MQDEMIEKLRQLADALAASKEAKIPAPTMTMAEVIRRMREVAGPQEYITIGLGLTSYHTGETQAEYRLYDGKSKESFSGATLDVAFAGWAELHRKHDAVAEADQAMPTVEEAVASPV